jgi:hypothetical protein
MAQTSTHDGDDILCPTMILFIPRAAAGNPSSRAAPAAAASIDS